MSGQVDPLVKYRRATKREVQLRVLINEAAVDRVLALAEMYEAGMSYGRIAEATGLSRSRAQQLVERGRVRHPAVPQLDGNLSE